MEEEEEVEEEALPIIDATQEYSLFLSLYVCVW